MQDRVEHIIIKEKYLGSLKPCEDALLLIG